jgi:hypothetical protein
MDRRRQQRSLALAQSKNSEVVVPVVGFVSADIRGPLLCGE